MGGESLERPGKTRLNLDPNGIFEDPIGAYWRVEPGNPKSRPQRVSRRW